ncbi:hypothetical protein AB0L00_31540 [Actinoallomurus sp. NPDC052308]|uniref:hypothetical protein n=1 Tax=Actinoallomurus sp. NPDC052308 TaxID=3155530 RepID=UPI00343932DB
MTEAREITDPIARATLESVRALNAAIDRLGLSAATAACELTQLDRLVRRYPDAARKSLEMYECQRRSGREVGQPSG